MTTWKKDFVRGEVLPELKGWRFKVAHIGKQGLVLHRVKEPALEHPDGVHASACPDRKSQTQNSEIPPKAVSGAVRMTNDE